MITNKQGIGNYVHSGGFNRLAGRPSAPGSWRPERSSARWRIFLVLCGMGFLLTGMFFVIF
ncbi:MAG: hypothetical protein E7053_03875 [Lentisphaerae bacterium]|nr:hypothetical protein [Lentisphaerota bacterium]